MTHGAENLAKRSVGAALWGFAGSGVRIIIQFAAQIALARILGPEQYGLYALGLMAIGFFLFFTDTGITYQLIQKQDITTYDQRFALTWQVLVGITLTLTVVIAAEALGIFFNNKDVAPVIRGLAIICFLQACSLVSTNLLRRRLDMKHTQYAQIGSYVVGYVLIGIPLALAGFGVWSLVIAWVVQASVNLLMLFSYARHPLVPLLWYDGARAASGYGGLVFLTNAVNWLIGSVDRIIVGRYFPVHAVGIYTTAYNLMSYGTTALHGVLQSVFFSTASKVQGDNPRLGRGTLVLIEAISLFALPAFAWVAAVSGPLVLTLYGVAWRDASEVLRPIALAMPMLLFLGVATPVLWNSGRKHQELLFQLPLVVVWAGVAWMAAQQSVEAVAWSVLGMFVIRTGIFLVLISRAIDLSLSALFRSFLPGAILGLVIAVMAMLIDNGLQVRIEQPSLLLLVNMVAIALLFAFLTYTFRRALLSPDLAELIQRAVQQISPKIGHMLSGGSKGELR